VPEATPWKQPARARVRAVGNAYLVHLIINLDNIYLVNASEMWVKYVTHAYSYIHVDIIVITNNEIATYKLSTPTCQCYKAQFKNIKQAYSYIHVDIILITNKKLLPRSCQTQHGNVVIKHSFNYPTSVTG